MRYIISILFLAITNFSLIAQTSIPNTKDFPPSAIVSPVPFAESITSQDLKKHLSILASDEFEGRETGTSGNDKAANYIAKQFKKMGLPPIGENNTSYFQKVSFNWTQWDNIGITINGKDYRHLWDFMSLPTQNSNRPSLETKEVIYLGYGIDDPKYSDYKAVNVKNKVILIDKGEPVSADGIYRISNSTKPSDWSDNIDKKLRLAKQKGVKTVLFIENNLKKEISENRKFLVGPKLTLGEETKLADHYANSFFISTTMAKKIMGSRYKKVIKARNKAKKSGRSKSVKLKTKLTLNQSKNVRELLGNNVLGYIEGTDEKLKDEVVIITAHYDHLGKRGDTVYNGADDNGSGTSSVLEVAQAFAQAKNEGAGPRRSVLTMLVTGEEKGLLGSQFYTAFPVFPLEKTVADINVDMVGRVDAKYKDNPNYIYVIGSDRLSTELHQINETANNTYTNLILDYTYNAESDPNRYYYRSDHYNFAKKGIPAIFYFNGTHADYHRTTDTVDKINFEKMETIARLVFYTAWELANRDKRIEVDVIGKN